MNEHGLVCKEEVDLLRSVSTWEGCRVRSITTSREGRAVVKLPLALKEESRRYSK